MDNLGWISLHRQFNNHWLWNEKRVFSKAEAWVDILMLVNHSDKKVVIKNVVYLVKRGESIMSLDSWAKRWKWNKSKVRRFFNVLQDELMIVTKNETKTTRLIVCNYDSYQTIGNADETQMKRKRNADETQTTPNNNDNNKNNDNNDNNDNNINKIEKFNFKKSLIEEGFEENLITDWLTVRKTKKLTNTKTAFEKFLNEIEKSNEDKNQVLKTCVENSWGGFNHQWLINIKNSNKVNHQENLTAVEKLNKALGL